MNTCVICGRKVLVLDMRTLDSGVCVNCQIRLDHDGDLDAHLADEFGTDDDDELMDPLGATLPEAEQRERFAGYGNPDRD